MKLQPTLEQHLLSNPSQNRRLFCSHLHSLVAQLHTWIIYTVTRLNVASHQTLWGWVPARFPRPCFWQCRCILPHPALPPAVTSFRSHLHWSCTSHPPPEQLHSCTNQKCKHKSSIHLNFHPSRDNLGVRRISCSPGSAAPWDNLWQRFKRPGTFMPISDVHLVWDHRCPINNK